MKFLEGHWKHELATQLATGNMVLNTPIICKVVLDETSLTANSPGEWK